jgi:hypothetical protein
MLKPTQTVVDSFREDLLGRPQPKIVLDDRLAVVKRLRELAGETWRPDTVDNPVVDMLLTFAGRLEREIREVG